MRFTPTRDFYRPKFEAAITDEALGVEVYFFDDSRTAKGFAGKRAKPDFYIKFGSTERREEYVNKWLDGLRKSMEDKIARRSARKEWQHSLKVGDIFKASWGYEQTNIDYYEVVAVKGKAVEVLELAQQTTETGWLQGDCVPVPGSYATEPDYDSPESKAHHEKTGGYLRVVPKARRMIPQMGHNGKPYLSFESYKYAHLVEPVIVAGIKCFKPDHWTAYA